MSHTKRSPHLIATLWFAGATILLGGLAPAAAGDFQQHLTLDGNELLLANLIGEIQIERGSSSSFEIDLVICGKDAAEDLIEIETKEGGEAELLIRFPLEDEDRYVYPPMGRRSKISFRPSSRRDGHSGWSDLLGLIGGRGQVEVRGRGSGMELWVDVTVKVPEGKNLMVRHGVGDITAEGIIGALDLDGIHGDMHIFELQGDLRADTGSGGVDVRGVTGDVNVDTGSGGVEIYECEGDEMLVDTGSGGVHLEEIRCQHLDIDTGSGGVRALAIATEAARIDTGSGSVTLELDHMGHGRFEIDTGSGSIDLRLPPSDVSAEISADTGSGSISVDVGRTRVRKTDELSMLLGDGDAQVILDAGSGSIRVSQ